MKLVSALAAACLAITGLILPAPKAHAGGIEVRIYERHTSYRHYERVTVLSRHKGYRLHGHRLHRPGYVYHNGLWFSPRSMRPTCARSRLALCARSSWDTPSANRCSRKTRPNAAADFGSKLLDPNGLPLLIRGAPSMGVEDQSMYH